MATAILTTVATSPATILSMGDYYRTGVATQETDDNDGGLAGGDSSRSQMAATGTTTVGGGTPAADAPNPPPPPRVVTPPHTPPQPAPPPTVPPADDHDHQPSKQYIRASTYDLVPGLHGTVGEQTDEADVDGRIDSHDDLTKGRIKFPEGRLYGREGELRVLREAYDAVVESCSSSGSRSSSSSSSQKSGRNRHAFFEEAGEGSNGDEVAEDDEIRLERADTAESDEVAAERSSQPPPPPQRPKSAAVFLGGHCGVGKSALVSEFLRRIRTDAARASSIRKGRRPPLFAMGKFSKNTTGAASDPYSAVAEAFGGLMAARMAEEEENEGENGEGGEGLEGRLEAVGLSMVKGPATSSGEKGGGGARRDSKRESFARQSVGRASRRSRGAVPPPSVRPGASLDALMKSFPALAPLLPGATPASVSRHGFGAINPVSVRNKSAPEQRQQQRKRTSAVMDRRYSVLATRSILAARKHKNRTSCEREDPRRFHAAARLFLSALCGVEEEEEEEHEGEMEEDDGEDSNDGGSGEEKLSNNRRNGNGTGGRILVLFLDDLQWADEASLHLLSSLFGGIHHAGAMVTAKPVKNVFFVGAYRNNEVDDDHPLTSTMAAIERGGLGMTGGCGSSSDPGPGQESRLARSSSSSFVRRLTLNALSRKDVTEFICDCLGYDDDDDDGGDDGYGDYDNYGDDDDNEVNKSSSRVEAVRPLADAVYDRTLGNAFFVKQALEELVRQNVLYYDVIAFEWRWTVGGGGDCTGGGTGGGGDHDEVDLGEKLSADVRDMVRSKLNDLPTVARRALVLAACSRRNAFDVNTVRAMLDADSAAGVSASLKPVTLPLLIAHLDRAADEGLIRRSDELPAKDGRYAFCHDTIMEAAGSIAEEGGRDDCILLCKRVASVLQDLHARAEAATVAMAALVEEEEEDEAFEDEQAGAEAAGSSKPAVQDMSWPEDWMLFVASDHLNAIPRNSELAPPPRDLARLNLRVARKARAKAAFGQATVLLRQGIHRLGGGGGCGGEGEGGCDGGDDDCDDEGWKSSKSYNLTLELHDLLLRTEFARGNYAAAERVARTVLSNARSTQDKILAHLTLVQSVSQGEDKDYEAGTRMGLEVLRSHGHRFPLRPTEARVWAEGARLKAELRGGPIRTIADRPEIRDEDEPLMMLLHEVASAAIAYQNQTLAALIALRAMRLSLVVGVSRHLAPMAVILGMPHLEAESFRKAYARGSLAMALLDRREDDGKSAEHALAEFRLHNSSLQLRKPFRDSFAAYSEVYEICMAYGSVDHALSVVMLYAMCYFAEGIPIHPVMEGKLAKTEHQAKVLGRSYMVNVFQMFRQFILNLQGKGTAAAGGGQQPPPAALQGRAFDAETVLERHEGNSKRMMLRDVNILRVQLAVIFGDYDAMESALDVLATVPVYDRVIVRQHLRLAFAGLAAFALGRHWLNKKDKRKRRRYYAKMGNKILRFFEKLRKSGSVNATPVCRCLVAAKKPGHDAYKRAVSACSAAQTLQLEALVTEQYGLFCGSVGDKEMERRHIEKAVALYRDWGAFGKARQLKEKYDFLRDFVPKAKPQVSERKIIMFSLITAC